jgi:hypothetical protein
VERGLIFEKQKGFFAKKPWSARSGPSACPIERPRKAGDVATLAGQLLEAGFIWKRYCIVLLHGLLILFGEHLRTHQLLHIDIIT